MDAATRSLGPNDEFGRVVETHGPCLVDSDTATDCPDGQPIPVTQYSYYPSTTSTADRSRLASIKRFASATRGACAGPGLTVSFGDYDAYGNPHRVVDENGVETRQEYTGSRLVRRATQGRVTEYAYEKDVLKSVKSPEGGYDVYCHRVSALGSGCPSSAAWSPQLQWKARAADGDGKEWTEGTLYTYWPDGRLKDETWHDETHGARRVIQHSADDEGRALWWRLGDTSASPLQKAWVYDAVGNLAGVGEGGGTVAPGCGGLNAAGFPSSGGCSGLTYDAARRLASLEDISGGTTRTCFTHDGQGQLTSVRAGCPKTASCEACAQPRLTYVHDDFGNVVEVQPPVVLAPTRMEYDAQGQLLRRQTPSMAALGEFQQFEYDGLGRRLRAVHTHQRPAPGAEGLYSFAYDEAPAPAGCPAAANTKGRVALKVDTFGRTFYSYSPWGEVVAEVRLRHGVDTCGGGMGPNPSATYEYDGDGHLAATVSPAGRRTEYRTGKYSNGASTGRLESVSVQRFEGTRVRAAPRVSCPASLGCKAAEVQPVSW